MIRLCRRTAWLGVLLVAGCAVGPDYVAPDMAARLPAQFDNGGPYARAARVPDRWWTALADPALDQLVADALARNQDMAVADANIRQARAALGIAAGAQGVQAEATSRAGRDRVSRNSEELANLPAAEHARTMFDNFRVGFDASWELDLFGHAARGVEAAKARLDGVEAQSQDVALRVAAEVARDVVDARALRARTDNAAAQQRDAESLLRLARLQEAAGAVSPGEVVRAESAAHAAAAAAPPLEAARRGVLAALGVLVDRPAGEIDALLARSAPLAAAPSASLPIGLPTDLLNRRPDIRVAERQLAAATADVGVAVADRYPRLSLVGSGGWNSLTLGTLGDAASRTWSFGPQLALPLMAGGRLRAQVQSREAQRDAALASYRRTVLAALADAETALARYQGERQRVAELEAARVGQAHEADLADRRYQFGETSQVEAIQARRQLADLDELRLASQQALSGDLIALFKALGGGVAADALP